MKKYLTFTLLLSSFFCFSQEVELSKQDCNNILSTQNSLLQQKNDIILEYELLKDIWIKHELRSDINGSQLYENLKNGKYRASLIINGDIKYSNIIEIGCEIKETTKDISSGVTVSNPFHSNLKISFNDVELAYTSYALFDISGRMVAAEKINDIRVDIDMANQPTGIYLIMLSDDQGNRLTEKLIKL